MSAASRDVILASASTSRTRILTAAGVAHKAIPADVDEAAVKAALKRDRGTALDCARTLAEMKAVEISRRYRDALVVGADQLLECDGRWFDKPANLKEAHSHLTTLAGKTHHLATATAVACAGTVIWHHSDAPKLTMRPMTPAFISAYLEAAGDGVLSSVGAYHLEGRGAQLFARVEGDFFTILGLPLLPLLAFLRQRGIVPS